MSNEVDPKIVEFLLGKRDIFTNLMDNVQTLSDEEIGAEWRRLVGNGGDSTELICIITLIGLELFSQAAEDQQAIMKADATRAGYSVVEDFFLFEMSKRLENGRL